MKDQFCLAVIMEQTSANIDLSVYFVILNNGKHFRLDRIKDRYRIFVNH